MLASHTAELGQGPAALFPIELPAHILGKAVGDDLGSWAPAAHGGDQDGACSSRLQPGPSPAAAITCGVNQLDGRNLPVYPPLSFALHFKYINRPYKNKTLTSHYCSGESSATQF